jgi:hypothetical protein
MRIILIDSLALAVLGKSLVPLKVPVAFSPFPGYPRPSSLAQIVLLSAVTTVSLQFGPGSTKTPFSQKDDKYERIELP